jgi:hypothetical protein
LRVFVARGGIASEAGEHGGGKKKEKKERKESMDEEEKRVSKYRLGDVVVGNEGETLGVEINDCSRCTGCLTREVTQVCVKGIGSPAESEFYILLGDATSM